MHNTSKNPVERELLPTGAILEIIDPIDPNTLQHLGQGVYEAKWYDAEQGSAEIESLSKFNGRITLVSRPYHPQNLPHWIAVQFIVRPMPLTIIEGVQ